VELAENYLKGA